MEVPAVLEQVEGSMAAKRVFSDPIEKDGAVLVLAATIRGGGGGGEGTASKVPGREGSGGGFGLIARPAGAFVLKDGRVSWRPAIDVNRIIIGAQLIAATLLFTVRSILRARMFAGALRPRLFGRRRA
jgi:uncharacterized spore protein YtfJ